jgi:hypothetical protein
MPADEPAEAAALRESAPSSNGFALSEKGNSARAPVAVEAAAPVEAAPLLAASPIEDFVKLMNELPR